MRKYVKSDINSYSYTGSGFADDSIVLAHYTKGTNNHYDDYIEVSLIQDGFTCYVEVEDFYDEHTYYKEYRMSDIESALDDFNKHVKALGGWKTFTMDDLDMHLSEGYGKSIYDYLPGGFYDNLRKNSGRGVTGSTKTRYMANMVSADSGMNKPLSRYMGARLMTQWTAMLNVIGAEESPDFEEYDQYFDGTLPECLNKLREYQRLIDDNGLDAYISLEAMRGGDYFEGTISQICEDLLNHDYITEEEYYDCTDGFYR